MECAANVVELHSIDWNWSWLTLDWQERILPKGTFQFYVWIALTKTINLQPPICGRRNISLDCTRGVSEKSLFWVFWCLVLRSGEYCTLILLVGQLYLTWPSTVYYIFQVLWELVTRKQPYEDVCKGNNATIPFFVSFLNVLFVMRPLCLWFR